MKPFLIIIFVSAGLGLAACEQGACYYTCCSDEAVCNIECSSQIESAEDCALMAEQTCRQNEERDIGRLEWKVVSDLYCDDCSSVACAPEWWTERKVSSTANDGTNFPDTSGTDDPDGG